MSYMDQCSTRRWVYHAVGTSVHSESCSTDSCHCTIWPKYSGQRCTYILLQVRNVLPPLVGHHDDSYTHVRQLLKARLFDNGCVTLSDFLFLWAVCKSSYLLICRGWCIYIYIYIYITDWSYSQIGKRNFWSLCCNWMPCAVYFSACRMHSSCMSCAALPVCCWKLFFLPTLSVRPSVPLSVSALLDLDLLFCCLVYRRSV